MNVIQILRECGTYVYQHDVTKTTVVFCIHLCIQYQRNVRMRKSFKGGQNGAVKGGGMSCLMHIIVLGYLSRGAATTQLSPPPNEPC